ncbi:MAG: FkbM family methyltransferase, partial [archaeon]|nr:FkbM family methyltransferase [archaeon]
MNDITLPNGENIQCLDELTAVYVYNEIYVENVYLSHGISIKEGDTILDIGANIGLFSKYIANQAPNLKIFTFEPVPVIFNVLERNLTNLPAKVKNYNIGLADETGEIDFFYYPKVCADSAAVQFDWEYKVNKYVENYKEAICKNMPIARIVP